MSLSCDDARFMVETRTTVSTLAEIFGIVYRTTKLDVKKPRSLSTIVYLTNSIISNHVLFYPSLALILVWIRILFRPQPTLFVPSGGCTAYGSLSAGRAELGGRRSVLHVSLFSTLG